MILDIDAGNSRVKWRLSGPEGGGIRRGECGNGEWQLSGMVADHCSLERVRIANVRGPEFESSMCEQLRSLCGIAPEFAQSSAFCAGVTSGYEEPESLGVDRWLAILAAYNDCNDGCCVVDAGTAITFDVIAQNGQHAGGFIVPGLQMQRRNLMDSTRIRLAGMPDWSGVGVGRSTFSAVHGGVASMVLDWIVNESKGKGIVYLTGGDASVLSNLLQLCGVRYCVVPDLVLDGLAFALP
jgi:type III pantothenate kinase